MLSSNNTLLPPNTVLALIKNKDFSVDDASTLLLEQLPGRKEFFTWSFIKAYIQKIFDDHDWVACSDANSASACEQLDKKEKEFSLPHYHKNLQVKRTSRQYSPENQRKIIFLIQSNVKKIIESEFSQTLSGERGRNSIEYIFNHYLEDFCELHHIDYFKQVKANLEEALLRKKEIDQASQWLQAIQSKDAQKIKSILRAGYIPEDLNSIIVIEEWEKQVESSLIRILIERNHLAEDFEYFKLADKLLRLGAILPKLCLEGKEYKNKSEYFNDLKWSPSDLYIALRRNPDIVKEWDENGQTLLHHVATIGLIAETDRSDITLSLLFEAPGINFSKRDLNGDTPLHVVARHGADKVTHGFTFKRFVRAAREHKFDFSTLNNEGHAIIHIVTRICYQHPFWGRCTNLNWFIKHVKHLDLNVLSSSGSSALYYAINQGYWDDANNLLDYGADPTRYGAKARDPLSEINKILRFFRKPFSEFNSPLEVQRKNSIIKQLTKIKQRIMTHIAEQEKLGYLVSDDKALPLERNLMRIIAEYFGVFSKNIPSQSLGDERGQSPKIVNTRGDADAEVVAAMAFPIKPSSGSR